MKINADRHRREQEFAPGDFVYLKLQPFRQMSIRVRGNMKLSPRFYDPFCVLERVGKVAYQPRITAKLTFASSIPCVSAKETVRCS